MSDKDTPPLTGKDLARKPRGFPDKRESLIHAQAGLVETITGVYRQWGFEALETSAFEYADALGKFLPDDDRPNAGVFAIQDDDEQWMSLRYDLTAPLARFVAEAGQSLGKPFRRYAAGPVWRNEKPGPGRFREFWQCDADTIGAPGYHADAEMIAMGAEALRAVGMAPGRMDESGDYTKGAGLGASEVTRVLAFAQAGADTRAETLANLVKATGDTEEGKAGLVELEAIAKALEALGAPEGDVVIDPSVVRGLEYYTGPVYEAELLREVTGEDGKTYRIGSIGGGGRYDDLVARFTGETVPATGFSIGISRLAAAMQIMGETEKLDGPVVVLNFDKEDPTSALQLATELRRAGIRPQMKYADRRSSPAVVMVGEDELAKGTVTIKDLEMGALKAKAIKSNEEYREARPGQFEVPRAEMVEAIRKITEAQK